MVELRGAERRRYVADLFSRIARRYDLLNDLMTFGMHRRWKRRTAQAAAAGLPIPSPPGPAFPGLALPGLALDVSTGTGDLAFELARCPGVNAVAAVDLLPAMLRLAREKGRRQRGGSAVSLLQGDAVSLPFADDSFACATAGFSLRNMPEVRAALAEMVRVVRPGGRVALLELSPLERGLKARAFRLYFHGFVPRLGRLAAGDAAAYTYLPQSVERFMDAEELAALLRELGLAAVEYRRLGFGTVCLHQGRKLGG